MIFLTNMNPLKNYISYVAQEPFLVKGNLGLNITLDKFKNNQDQFNRFFKKIDFSLDNSFNFEKNIMKIFRNFDFRVFRNLYFSIFLTLANLI